MTRCESYPPCFGTIYFPTAPFYCESPVAKHSGQTACRLARLCFRDANLYEQEGRQAGLRIQVGLRECASTEQSEGLLWVVMPAGAGTSN